MANAFKNMDDKINLLAARVDTHDTSLNELEGTGDLVKGLMNALEEASVNNENMRKQHETIRSDIRVLLDRTNDLEDAVTRLTTRLTTIEIRNNPHARQLAARHPKPVMKQKAPRK